MRGVRRGWMIALSGAFFAMSRYAIIDWGIFFLQVKKGYAATEAASIVTVNSVIGGITSALCGWFSDRFFKGNRNGMALTFGLMNVAALALFIERSAEGGKLASHFITTTLFGHTVDAISLFWIGAALLSVLCALSVWRVRK